MSQWKEGWDKGVVDLVRPTGSEKSRGRVSMERGTCPGGVTRTKTFHPPLVVYGGGTEGTQS